MDIRKQTDCLFVYQCHVSKHHSANQTFIRE